MGSPGDVGQAHAPVAPQARTSRWSEPCLLNTLRIHVLKHIRPAPPSVAAEQWQHLQDDVRVELTSEDPASPIEGALLAEESIGWRASEPGRQTITLTWPAPIAIRRIRLVF